MTAPANNKCFVDVLRFSEKEYEWMNYGRKDRKFGEKSMLMYNDNICTFGVFENWNMDVVRKILERTHTHIHI